MRKIFNLIIDNLFFSVGGTPGPGRKKANSTAGFGVTPQNLTNKILSVRNENIFKRMKKFMTWEELWQEEQFLVYFLRFFSASEKVTLAQVCILASLQKI